MVWRVLEEKEPSYTVGRNITWLTATMQKSVDVPQKTKTRATI